LLSDRLQLLMGKGRAASSLEAIKTCESLRHYPDPSKTNRKILLVTGGQNHVKLTNFNVESGHDSENLTGLR
jgi:hypothetical protein